MKTFLVISLVAISLSVQASTQKTDGKVMSYLFDAQLSQADSLIELQIKKQPNHPKYYFLKAHYAFYMRYFSQQAVSRDSILQVIIHNAQKAVELGERVEQTTENKFYIGSALGFLSRAHIMRQELWDGYWAGRKCRDYLGEVLEEDSSFFDAYVGMGVIEYYPDRLTGFQGFLAWLGGMSGEWDQGQQQFRERARNEVYALIEKRQWKGTFFGRVLALFGVQRGLRRLLARLAQDGREQGIAPEQIRETVQLARRAHRTALMVAHYEDLRAVLGTWRYLHRWVAVLMVLLVTVHIVHALMYGSFFFEGSVG